METKKYTPISVAELAKASCKCDQSGWSLYYNIPCCDECGLPVEREIQKRKSETKK